MILASEWPSAMAPRLRALHRAEDIGSALKRGVNVCQRQPVNEVLGPLVTEFVRNFGREDATPIQLDPNASLFGRVQAVKHIRHSAAHSAAGEGCPNWDRGWPRAMLGSRKSPVLLVRAGLGRLCSFLAEGFPSSAPTQFGSR